MTGAEGRREVIAAVLAEHSFKSTSSSRGVFTFHHAGCSCDPSIEFDWHRRCQEHLDHLHAAIFDAGRAAALGAALGSERDEAVLLPACPQCKGAGLVVSWSNGDAVPCGSCKWVRAALGVPLGQDERNEGEPS